MPATFVLSGVRSPRTYASSVTCSALPPSQEFQLRVSVITIAAASRSTMIGVRTFFQPASACGAACSCSAAGFGADEPGFAGTGVDDIDVLLGNFSRCGET